jgi:hypothetical protein
MDNDLQLRQRVNVVGIGLGWIIKVRHDDRGDALYTILMEDSKATLDGEFLARRCELEIAY